jgi:hypothetical protein
MTRPSGRLHDKNLLFFMITMFLMLWKNIKKFEKQITFSRILPHRHTFLYLRVLRWIQRARGACSCILSCWKNKFMCIYLHALVQQQKQRWAVSMATQGAWRHTLTSHVTAMNAAIMIGGAQWERANTHQEREMLKETFFAGICYSLALFSHVYAIPAKQIDHSCTAREPHTKESSAKTQSGSSSLC